MKQRGKVLGVFNFVKYNLVKKICCLITIIGKVNEIIISKIKKR